MTDNPRRRTGEAHRSFGDEGGLVVRPTRSEVKVLNSVGSLIYGMLDGAHSREAIVRAVAEAYDVPEDRAREDVEAFLGELEAEGMLEHAAGSDEAAANGNRPHRAGEGR